MRPAGRAKLQDVARVAGVSLATASRALNSPDIVSIEVRQRIAAAVKSLGYAPDRNARALSSGRSHTVGAVVPTLGNAIFAYGIEALQDRLGERGYTLLLSNSRYDLDKERLQIKALLEHRVDGLVLVGDSFAPDVLPMIRQYAVPVVTTYVCESVHDIPAIGIDNGRAAFQMAQHLLDLGHREFAVIANISLSNDRSRDRLKGVLRALGEAGIALPPERIITVDQPSTVNGRAALRQALSVAPDITALVCTTDALAIGALAEARLLGIAVPKRLSISGYDDVEIAADVDPPLTTINVPAIQIGRLAADHIVEAIELQTIPLTARFPARLVERGSTGKAPAARRTTTVS